MAVQNSIDLTATGVITHDGAGVFTGSSITQYTTLVGDSSNTITGAAVGTSGQVLTSNGAGAAPTYQDASGGIAGPVSSTDNALARWNGTGGGTLQDSTVTVTDNGEMTNTSQPAFCAYLGTDDTNVTGDGTQYFLGDTAIGNTLTERFDQNSDLNPGASGGAVFTAPVTGNYYFNLFMFMQGFDGSSHAPQFDIVTSNETYIFGPNAPLPSGNNSQAFAVLADMDSADTAKFSVTVSSGSKVIDLLGNGTTPRTVVSGFLAC